MIKSILITLFLSLSTVTFSQNNQVTAAKKTNNTDLKSRATSELKTFDKSESNKNPSINKVVVLPKPELKAFAVYQSNTDSKKTDTINLPKPELIPYTGYKKGKDN